MDKYQEEIMKQVRIYCVNNRTEQRVSTVFSNNMLTINQSENINDTEYTLYIDSELITAINCVMENKLELMYEKKEIYGITKPFTIHLDFKNKINKLLLKIKDDLVDDIEIKVNCVDADVALYYSKQNEIKRQQLLRKLSVSHSCGQDLVNIRFQNCNEDVFYTQISLFSNNHLMAKYKVENGQYFKAIKDLAYGDYSYIVEQFDKSNNLIIKTDSISFKIKEPNYSGKPTIVI